MSSKEYSELPDLPRRRRELLHAVIREYISSAQPVASGALVRRYRLPVSPATVRHELAELEELGLLTHPHTSAGRVPTDLGYRYFIESLMPATDLAPDEQVTVSHQFRQAQAADWLRLAASILARLTAEAAIVTSPPRQREDVASHPLWMRDVYYDGIQYILAQPEFEEAERVRDVLDLLEDRTRLARVIPDPLAAGDVHVAIGSELRSEALRGCSVVIGTYEGREASGYIGVLGPTRMDYARSIGAVRYFGVLMTDVARFVGA